MNNRLLLRVLRLALVHPRKILLLWLALVAIAAPAVLQLEISTSTDSVLDRSGPAWSFYQSSKDLFGGDEILVVALRSETPFDASMLGKLDRLTSQLSAVPGVRRVDSLATVPLVRVRSEDEVDLSASLARGVPDDPDELRSLRAALQADRIAPRSLLSADERVTAINIQLESDSVNGFDAVVAEVRALAGQHGGWVSGVPVFRAEINRTAGLEIAKFVLITIMVVGGVFLFMIRSVWAVVTALGVGGVGTWITMAALGASGTPLTLVTVVLPSLMLALGCAYSMHLIAAARNVQGAESLEAALSPVLEPTALSGLTTAIGFLAVAAIRIDAVQQVGTYGALGVFAVVSAALTVVPAVIRLRPMTGGAPPLQSWLRESLPARLLGLAERKSSMMVTGWALVAAVFGFGLSQATVETDVTRWFPKGSDVRDSYEEIKRHLSGISPMNVVVQSDGVPVTDPSMLASIDGLVAYLQAMPEVGKAIALTDPLRQLHAGFAADPASPLPESRLLAEQYLLLLESVEYMEDLVSFDRATANVVLRVDHNGSEHLLAVARLAEEWWRDHGPAGTTAQTTGIMHEFARAQDEIAFGQARGLGFALLTIMILMFAIYRSVRIAAVAMVPNVLPLVLVFGFLGLASIPMDAGIVVSGCLILGIAVDDTLHLVSAFRRHSLEGMDAHAALRAALRRVVTPVVLTTCVVGIGFLALASASFAFVRNLGILVVFVMLICFLADVLLLPSLLLRFGKAR